jgi:hypothetical protein
MVMNGNQVMVREEADAVYLTTQFSHLSGRKEKNCKAI